MAASPANPGSRCRNFGIPVRARMGFRRASCFTRAWMAWSRSAWLSRWTVILSCCNVASRGWRDKPGHDEFFNMPPPVFRFAPSPNGYLHLGHAYSALLNFDLARQAGGRLLVRMEDIDPLRCRPGFGAAICGDLAWLGIAWETPVRRQSEHLDVYRAATDRLARDGLLYPSFESRADIARLFAAEQAAGAWPHDPDGVPLYPGVARTLSQDA